MSKPEQAQEPSMEEILASIRKIISDEDDQATADDEAAKAAESAPTDEAASDMEFEAVEAEVFADTPPEPAAPTPEPDPVETVMMDDFDAVAAEPEIPAPEPDPEPKIVEGADDLLELSQDSIVDDEPAVAIVEAPDADENDLDFMDDTALAEPADAFDEPKPVPSRWPLTRSLWNQTDRSCLRQPMRQ